MKFNDLGKQWEEIREQVLPQIDALGFRGDYIGGSAVSEFEANFAAHFGAKYAVGISNGTDALKIAFQMFDLSSEDVVVMPPNTFIADYLALRNLPVSSQSYPAVFLVDHDEYFTLDMGDLEKFLVSKRSKFRKVVVVAVHLYGHPCNLPKLKELKEKFDFLILEDCSQSHGTRCKVSQPGTVGEISIYSLYPGKNLGALGDAGILTTQDSSMYERAKTLRNYGSKVKYHYQEMGNNHRLDTIQALILNHKLERLPHWNDAKQKIAQRYLNEIRNIAISLPKQADWCEYHSYHIFCIKILGDREKFISHLNKFNIPSIIHYPIPIHQTQIFGTDKNKDFIFNTEMTDLLCDRILSLPMHPFMTEEETSKVIEAVNLWSPS